MSSLHHSMMDNMTFPMKALIAGVAVTLMGAIALWSYGPTAPMNETVAPSAPPSHASAAKPIEAPPAAVPKEEPKSVAVPAPKKVDKRAAIANEFRSAKNLKSFYDKYAGPGYANDGAAVYYLAKAVVECQNWESITSEKFATTMFGADYKSNPIVQERLSALRQHEDKCRGFPKQDGKESTRLFNQAALLNDPAGVAGRLSELYRGGQQEEAASIAQQLLRNPNGDLAPGLIRYFSERKEPWVIGENGTVNRREISEEAWTLAACSWGADCGPTSNGLQFTCITQGICQVASYDDYLQRYRLSPSDYQTVVQLANQITSAVAAQNWAVLGLTTRGNAESRK
jgi:hypothetical protein